MWYFWIGCVWVGIEMKPRWQIEMNVKGVWYYGTHYNMFTMKLKFGTHFAVIKLDENHFIGSMEWRMKPLAIFWCGI